MTRSGNDEPQPIRIVGGRSMPGPDAWTDPDFGGGHLGELKGATEIEPRIDQPKSGVTHAHVESDSGARDVEPPEWWNDEFRKAHPDLDPNADDLKDAKADRADDI